MMKICKYYHYFRVLKEAKKGAGGEAGRNKCLGSFIIIKGKGGGERQKNVCLGLRFHESEFFHNYCKGLVITRDVRVCIHKATLIITKQR